MEGCLFYAYRNINLKESKADIAKGCQKSCLGQTLDICLGSGGYPYYSIVNALDGKKHCQKQHCQTVGIRTLQRKLLVRKLRLLCV